MKIFGEWALFGALSLCALGCGPPPSVAPIQMAKRTTWPPLPKSPDGQIAQLKEIRALRALGPDTPRLQREEARLCAKLGARQEALTLFSSLWQRRPSFALRAAIRELVVQTNDWRRWQQLASVSGGQRPLDLVTTAFALAGTHSFGQARTLLRNALKAAPGDPVLLSGLAGIYLMVGKPGLSMLVARQARDTRPTLELAWSIETAATARALPIKAQALFEAALERFPQASIRLAYALFLLGHGAPKQAHAQVTRWLQIAPLDAQAQQLLHDIEQVTALETQPSREVARAHAHH